MQKRFIIFLFLFPALVAAAQNGRPPVYFFTQISERYFTDTEIDSLYYTNAKMLFNENGVPDALFEKKYPAVKNMLLLKSKVKIKQAFNAVEYEQRTNARLNKEPLAYNEIKDLYTAAFQKQVQNTLSGDYILSKYLSFGSSDRIMSFNSTVRVGTDGKLLVQEDITVYNGNGQVNPLYANDEEMNDAGDINNEIKRGIVRTFPLYYINQHKLFQNTTFKLKEILRDGKPEEYHTEKVQNGIVLYLGNAHVFLNNGIYKYRIVYETDHQLKLLNNFDELYWNVTGNGWSFRIDSASCTVILPKGANILSSKCYTGPQGSKDEDCVISSHNIGDSAVIVFKTRKTQQPYHGFTIASSWQKGIVSSPTAGRQMGYYIWNNKAVFFLPLAALFSLIFCFIFWLRYGRDPEKGVIYPLFEPPAGFSPAALGYIFEQKFTQQLTAATIVDAAVRNKIKIDVKRAGLILKHNAYSISKTKAPEKPAASKYADFGYDVEKLVGTTIEKGNYNSTLESLNTKVKNHCIRSYKNKDGALKQSYKGLFALNNRYTILPVLVCLVAAGWAFFDGVVLAFQVSNYRQIAYFIAGALLCIIVLRVFANLLRAYSPEGRLLMDKIEGFRMFLNTADEKRFDMMSPPQKSLELYEKYLPFAIALDCEIEWGKKFEDIISTAIISGAAASSFSQSFAHDSQNFSSSFTSSFSGAISSASTPPSSSSDGGSSYSGGSSGGGGGGGGGGGW
jgi:uncharacterized membrane protein